MLTKQDLIEFRVALIRAEKRMKVFCLENGFDRAEFAAQLNGFAKIKPATEAAIRKVLSSVGYVPEHN